jgi:AAA+ superfamily predicted ATPase
MSFFSNIDFDTYDEDGPELGERIVAKIIQSRISNNEDNENENEKNEKWTEVNFNIFTPVGKTIDCLEPGFYDIFIKTGTGICFEKIPIKTEDLIVFEEHETHKVVSEIKNFWGKEELFKLYNLPFKRGILLYGPPGCGKTCIIQILMRDIINQGGICINFDDPYNFQNGFKAIRRIQKDTPIIAIIEDIDSMMKNYDASEILNILDGCGEIDKCVFLASTNYPERLEKRISNRPSRFDRRYKVNLPSDNCRKIYLENLSSKNGIKIDIDKWVRETKDMSFAHLKEIFISVYILGNSYEESLQSLIEMQKKKINSDDDSDDGKIGGFTNRFRSAGFTVNSETE